MPSLLQIRRRIRSVRNTAKVTRAMEMIAATKLRRVQQRALQSRPYSEKLMSVLTHLATQPFPEDQPPHPLMVQRPVRRVVLVHFTTDRGLAGALNANVNRVAGQFVVEHKSRGVDVSVVTIGRKGRDFMTRTRQEVRAVFTNMGDSPQMADLLPIARLAQNDFTSGYADEIWVCYPKFVNTLVQRPTLQKVLPMERPAEPEPGLQSGYIYEPNPWEVFGSLVPRFFEMQLYQAMLETVASEQAARMVTMRSATDNAKEVIEDLTLQMNKVRQSSITSELLDIVGAVSAVEG